MCPLNYLKSWESKGLRIWKKDVHWVQLQRYGPSGSAHPFNISTGVVQLEFPFDGCSYVEGTEGFCNRGCSKSCKQNAIWQDFPTCGLFGLQSLLKWVTGLCWLMVAFLFPSMPGAQLNSHWILEVEEVGHSKLARHPTVCSEQEWSCGHAYVPGKEHHTFLPSTEAVAPFSSSISLLIDTWGEL